MTAAKLPTPVTALALQRAQAAAALDISPSAFDEHVRPYVRVVRLGGLKLYPVRELERWLEEQAGRPLAKAI